MTAPLAVCGRVTLAASPAGRNGGTAARGTTKSATGWSAWATMSAHSAGKCSSAMLRTYAVETEADGAADRGEPWIA
ncbi:hypothetical protein ACF1BP_01850 [Streptomyces sp. NPDC014735]|uniref:hypothetical protein n=1 Tax=unclassified Streptomyces TaxID=2593676 RepID=UPI00370105D3